MKPVSIFSTAPAKGWIPWGFAAPFLSLVLIVVPSLPGDLVLEDLGLVDVRGHPVGMDGFAAMLLLPFGLMGLAVLAWVHLVERRGLDTVGLGGTGGASKFVLGHAVGLLTISAIAAVIWACDGYEVGAWAKALSSGEALAGIGILLVCFAVQSSVEEFVFRGWLLSAIARRLNVAVAVVLTSMVFSLLHYGPGQFWLVTLNTFLFSVFACAWALNAGSIWGVMGWHAGWNWLLATGFELPVTGLDANVPALLVELNALGPDVLTGGAQGPEGSVACTVFFAGAIGWRMWRFRGHPDASRAAG
jgi:membrane protease YdiL (CAAX protease family)